MTETYVIHPITRKITTEANEMMLYEDMPFVGKYPTFKAAEIATETGFALVGELDGQPFRTELSEEQYFEGKYFMAP